MSGEADYTAEGMERLRSAERCAGAILKTEDRMRNFDAKLINLSLTKEDLERELATMEKRMYRLLREVQLCDEDTRRLSEFIFEKQRVCDRWAVLLTRFK